MTDNDNVAVKMLCNVFKVVDRKGVRRNGAPDIEIGVLLPAYEAVVRAAESNNKSAVRKNEGCRGKLYRRIGFEGFRAGNHFHFGIALLLCHLHHFDGDRFFEHQTGSAVAVAVIAEQCAADLVKSARFIGKAFRNNLFKRHIKDFAQGNVVCVAKRHIAK